MYEEQKNRNRKLFVPVIVVVIVLIFFLTQNLFSSKKTLIAEDYIHLEVSGLDGEGIASLSFDYDALYSDMSANDPLTVREKEEISSILTDVAKDFAINPSKDLKNGDQVEVQSGIAKNILKSYGVVFKSKPVTLEVSGLTEVTTIHLQDYITIEYSGFEGYGTGYTSFDWTGLQEDVIAQIQNADDSQTAESYINNELSAILYGIYTDPSSFENLSNGDKVSTTICMEQTEISQYGIFFESGELSADISGLIPVEEISLEDYILCDVTGYEGNGTASLSMDREKLSDDLAELFEKDSRGAYGSQPEEGFEDSDLMSVVDAVEDAWKYSFSSIIDQTEELSNGDVLKISCKASSDPYYLSSVGILLKGFTTEITAEGLTPSISLNLTDYVSCSFSGYDGAGSVIVSLDQEKLETDLGTQFEENGREDLEAVLEAVANAWDMAYTISVEDDPFSNGDKVAIAFSREDGEPFELSDLGLSVFGGEMEVEVSGLDKPQEIDLADAISVTFSGACPQVFAEISIDEEAAYASATSLGELYSTNIIAENGDSFEGDITYDAEALLEMGYVVTNAHYSFTVSGLPSYNFQFDSLEDPELLTVVENANESVFSLLGENEEWILDGSQGWVLWDQTKITLISATKQYNRQADGDYNNLILHYKATLKIKDLDRTVEEKEIFSEIRYADILDDAAEGWSCEDEEDVLFSTEEAALEWQEECRTSLGEETAVVSLDPVPLEEEAETEAETEAGTENAATSAAAEEALSMLSIAAPVLSDEDMENAGAVLSYNGHTYLRYDQSSTWEAAEEFCEQAGGHLATVTSAREWYAVASLLNDAPSEEYWIGATDKTQEGVWNWVTGEDFSWTSWNNSQPDNSEDNTEEAENYLTMGSRYSENWNDQSNDLGAGFVMELDPETTAPDGSENLTDLTPTSGDCYDSKASFQDPYGSTHFWSLSLNASEDGWVTYDLDAQWKALALNLTTWSECASDAAFDIAFWGDGELLYSVYNYQKTDAAMPIGIDLTGVRELTIVTCNRGGSDNGYLMLNESILLPASDSVQISQTTAQKDRLRDLTLIDSSSYESPAGAWTDLYGNLHDGRTRLCASENGRAIWNLNGEYQRLTGKLVLSRGAYNEQTAVDVEILADGESLFQVSNYEKFQGTLEIDLDVSGKQTLEFTSSTGEDVDDVYVYLVDELLTKNVSEESESETSEETEAQTETEISDDPGTVIILDIPTVEG